MTAVLDASVLVEYLVGSDVGQATAERARAHAGELHIPHLAVIETTSILRSWVIRSEIDPGRAADALTDLADFPARRWPSEVLLSRVWELRRNLTAYDATYVALAEALDAELLTADFRLARGAGGLAGCDVIVLA